jgi:hypothetical protein
MYIFCVELAKKCTFFGQKWLKKYFFGWSWLKNACFWVEVAEKHALFLGRSS